MSGEIVRYDKTRESLTRGLAGLTARVEGTDIALPGVEGAIQEMTVRAQEALDIAKDRARRECEPHAAALADVKVKWRPLVDGFDALFRRLKTMGSDVLRRKRDEEERLRREAQARLDAAREAERKAAEDANVQPDRTQAPVAVHREALGELRSARAAVDALPPPGAPIGVKTSSGTLSGRKKWKWELTKLEDVPETYVTRQVDPTKVDLAVSNGVRTIPGIRIYEDVEMVSRRTKGRR